jgi:hypothetical protein
MLGQSMGSGLVREILRPSPNELNAKWLTFL